MKLLRYIFALVFSIVSQLIAAQNLQRYNIHIVMPKGSWISGIAVVRQDSADGTMSVVNEFGIKMFDAKYSVTKGKAKLHNVIKPLDKWHIRRIVAQDMTLLFIKEQKDSQTRSITTDTDGTITIANRRHKITYTLHPIENAAE